MPNLDVQCSLDEIVKFANKSELQGKLRSLKWRTATTGQSQMMREMPRLRLSLFGEVSPEILLASFWLTNRTLSTPG